MCSTGISTDSWGLQVRFCVVFCRRLCAGCVSYFSSAPNVMVFCMNETECEAACQGTYVVSKRLTLVLFRCKFC